MKRRRIGVVAGALVAALVAGGLTASQAASSGGVQVIKLKAGDDRRELIDLGTAGPSPGDMLVGRVDVLQKGKEVGFVHFTCVFNFGPRVMCTEHLTLRGRGQIVSQQSGNTNRTRVVEAITGGTGEFRRAHGTVRIDFATGNVTVRVLR